MEIPDTINIKPKYGFDIIMSDIIDHMGLTRVCPYIDQMRVTQFISLLLIDVEAHGVPSWRDQGLTAHGWF